MTNIGALANAINAQNVVLEVASSANEVISLFDIQLTDESILDRRNTRAGAIDTPTYNMVEVTASAVVTDDVYNQFVALRTLGDTGSLTTDTFEITGTSFGTGTVVAAGTYVLRRLELIAQETGRCNIRLTMRITAGATYS